jgi:hypothetical protein
LPEFPEIKLNVLVFNVEPLKNFPFMYPTQNALNAQRVTSLVKTAEMMGILDSTSERRKQSDLDEILGFLAALEKVRKITITDAFSQFLAVNCESTSISILFLTLFTGIAFGKGGETE